MAWLRTPLSAEDYDRSKDALAAKVLFFHNLSPAEAVAFLNQQK